MTAKRPNKPQRLSTLPATLTFNDYSDYEGAPESSDFQALPYRLSTLRLFPSDFGAGRHTHPEALAERSGQPPKKSAGPRHTRQDRLRPCLDPGHPHDGPQKPPDGSIGGRIYKPRHRRNGPQRATGDAIHGNGWDANATRKRRKAAGRKKNKAG